MLFSKLEYEQLCRILLVQVYWGSMKRVFSVWDFFRAQESFCFWCKSITVWAVLGLHFSTVLTLLLQFMVCFLKRGFHWWNWAHEVWTLPLALAIATESWSHKLLVGRLPTDSFLPRVHGVCLSQKKKSIEHPSGHLACWAMKQEETLTLGEDLSHLVPSSFVNVKQSNSSVSFYHKWCQVTLWGTHLLQIILPQGSQSLVEIKGLYSTTLRKFRIQHRLQTQMNLWVWVVLRNPEAKKLVF